MIATIFAVLDPPKPAPRVPARVRPDFVLPALNCPHCGHPCEAEAYYDIDSWDASLDCDNAECMLYFHQEIPWPFVDDKAAPSDWELLGIRVI